MEKLERVLVAEDDARGALEDARSESARIRAGALEDVRRIESDAAAACDATIASERAAALDAARTEAARIAQEATGIREATLNAARGRIDAAARAIAESLEA